jgi:cobalt-zinc-cadmium efflux system protein
MSDHHHHHHDHDGGHSHGHAHAPASFDRAFAIGVVLNAGFVLLEFVYGVLAHSLALVADAGHNLSDVAGLLMAWSAAWIARRPASRRRTYGFGRATILAALGNAILLLVAIGAIAWEAIDRFAQPEPVAGVTVMVVAGVGIAINGLTALLFMSGRKSDINIRGAFLHMASDAVVSLGVVLAGAAILATGWTWLDPTVSLLIVAAIAAGTWGLLRDSVALAVDSVPACIDVQAVHDHLMGLPEVVKVHDLHIWPLSTTRTACTVHLVRTCGGIDDAFNAAVAEALRRRFNIGHTTVQVETEAAECGLAHGHAH